jgi:hypothetical protein
MRNIISRSTIPFFEHNKHLINTQILRLPQDLDHKFIMRQLNPLQNFLLVPQHIAKEMVLPKFPDPKTKTALSLHLAGQKGVGSDLLLELLDCGVLVDLDHVEDLAVAGVAVFCEVYLEVDELGGD